MPGIRVRHKSTNPPCRTAMIIRLSPSDMHRMIHIWRSRHLSPGARWKAQAITQQSTTIVKKSAMQKYTQAPATESQEEGPPPPEHAAFPIPTSRQKQCCIFCNCLSMKSLPLPYRCFSLKSVLFVDSLRPNVDIIYLDSPSTLYMP